MGFFSLIYVYVCILSVCAYISVRVFSKLKKEHVVGIFTTVSQSHWWFSLLVLKMQNTSVTDDLKQNVKDDGAI